MTAVNEVEINTLQDYIYVLCYYKALTLEQLCVDLDIPYDSFMTSITTSINNKLLDKIMDHLDGDILFAFNLPLTSNKNKPLEITPSHILSPDEFKHTEFESSSECYTQFSRSVNHFARQHNVRTKILSTTVLARIMKNFTNIIAEPFKVNGTVEYRLYKRNYDKPIYYMLTSDNIQNDLYEIQCVLGAENANVWREATSIVYRLAIFARMNEFPQYNPAPSYYVLASNGIFNRKTKEFYPENSTEYNKLTHEYHFIANASFNYLAESKNPEIIELYEEVIEHVSGGNKELRDKLEQQLCSAIEGCNHDGLVVITSSSHINLRAFRRLIQVLAGELLWDPASIYETKKDSDLNYINYNSKLLISQITDSQTELSPRAIEKCKRIFRGESFITSNQKRYKTYFKLHMPWIQLVQNKKDLKSLEHDTRDFNAKIIKISDKNVSKRFTNKFYDIMDANTSYGSTDRITTFADEIASYLLNNVDYPTN